MGTKEEKRRGGDCALHMACMHDAPENNFCVFKTGTRARLLATLA